MTETHSKENKDNEGKVETQEEDPTFKTFCKPHNFAKILGNMKSVFGIWGLVGYFGHFFLIIIALNLYCDHDRLLSCGDPN